MHSTIDFTVRPLPNSRTIPKDTFRVFLSSTALLRLNIRAGDALRLNSNGRESSRELGQVHVEAWLAQDKINEQVVQTSKAVQNCSGLKLGDKVKLEKCEETIGDCSNLYLRELAGDQSTISSEQKSSWEQILSKVIGTLGTLGLGIQVEAPGPLGVQRTFVIQSMDCQAESNSSSDYKISQSLGHFTESQTKVHILGTQTATALPMNSIPGFEFQIDLLNIKLRSHLERSSSKASIKQSSSLLFHGPSGSGKSMLLDKIADLGWVRVLRIDNNTAGITGPKSKDIIQEVFEKAILASQSLILIDDLDDIASSSISRGNAHAMKAGVNRAKSSSTPPFIIAAARSLDDIDVGLLKFPRFSNTIEISAPNTKQRCDIFRAVLKARDLDTKIELESIAAKTSGYIGADLEHIIDFAQVQAESRMEGVNIPNGTDANKTINTVNICTADWKASLLAYTPSSMKDVSIEIPNVRWTDVGGQETAKRELQEAVLWHLKRPDLLKDSGVTPPKGLLLYGPPGCSKTLLAKALATESGYSFLAVKGAELVSKYVGDSEKAVREIFRKARSMSPSILFFDEIDAIAIARERNQSNGLNIVTTLLNEMDGIELLKDVFVLAATNMPEVLDLALLRPGRLDSSLYIGLPDESARLAILEMGLSKMRHVLSDVDASVLASRMGGHSGAEVVQIVQVAGKESFRENFRLDQRQPVGMSHFEVALSEVDKGVSSDDVKRYKDWAKKRR